MDVLVVTVVHDPEDARIRHRQIRALVDAGHRVTLAAPFSGYARPMPDDLSAVDLPRAHGLHRTAAARAVRRLLKARAHRFNIVLVHDPELVPVMAGLDIPGAVWDVHEDTAAAIEMKTWLPGFARPAAVAAIRGAERYAEKRMSLILAEESYADRFGEHHAVVGNSVVVPDLPDHSTPRDNRVIYLGRLTRARGAAEMVELGRRLAPEIEIHLLGPADDDCATDIRAAHDTGAVHWHGFRPNDEALAMLPGALAGLSLLHDQPNYAWSRPTKLIEYMAHGLPVITTPNPSSAELVHRHGCGVVVPFGDVAATEAAVRDLAGDLDEHRRFSAAGRAAARENYSWQAHAGVFVDTLEKVAAEAAR